MLSLAAQCAVLVAAPKAPAGRFVRSGKHSQASLAAVAPARTELRSGRERASIARGCGQHLRGCSCTVQGGSVKPLRGAGSLLPLHGSGGAVSSSSAGPQKGGLYGNIRQQQMYMLLCRQGWLPCSAQSRDGALKMHYVTLIPGYGWQTRQRLLSDV